MKMKNTNYSTDMDAMDAMDLEELKTMAKRAKKRDRKLEEKKLYHANKLAKELGDTPLKARSKKRLRVEAEDAETAAYLKAFNL